MYTPNNIFERQGSSIFCSSLELAGEFYSMSWVMMLDFWLQDSNSTNKQDVTIISEVHTLILRAKKFWHCTRAIRTFFRTQHSFPVPLSRNKVGTLPKKSSSPSYSMISWWLALSWLTIPRHIPRYEFEMVSLFQTSQWMVDRFSWWLVFES